MTDRGTVLLLVGVILAALLAGIAFSNRAGVQRALIGIDRLSTVIGQLGGWMILALTGVIVYDVTARRFFRAPTDWAYDTSYMLYGTLFMLAGAYALSRNGHVRGDFLYRNFRPSLQAKFGVFPLFKFWGPGADISSSRWIADASLEVMARHSPSLTLVYLPHLDYNLQRLGPDDPRIASDIRQIDAEAGRLIDAARARVAGADAQIAVLHKAIADATITAPIAGVVTETLADVGELLQPRAPVVVITDLQHAWANVYVGERDVPRLKIGQHATIFTDAGGAGLPGVVSYISPRAEFTPRNVQTSEDRSKLVYRIKLTVDNAAGVLKPGMPVEAELPLGGL